MSHRSSTRQENRIGNDQARAPGNGASPIDARALDRLRMLDRPGRPSVFAKILSQYLVTSDESMGALRDALRAGDAVALSETAHRLKSGSAQVGACSIAARCQELESIGRARTVEGAAAIFERVEAEYREVARVLRSALSATTGDRT